MFVSVDSMARYYFFEIVSIYETFSIRIRNENRLESSDYHRCSRKSQFSNFFSILCLFYLRSPLEANLKNGWKRLNVAKHFRYLHKIMLLGDTLEFKFKQKEWEMDKIEAV